MQQGDILTEGDCADMFAKGFRESNGATMALAPLSEL